MACGDDRGWGCEKNYDFDASAWLAMTHQSIGCDNTRVSWLFLVVNPRRFGSVGPGSNPAAKAFLSSKVSFPKTSNFTLQSVCSYFYYFTSQFAKTHTHSKLKSTSLVNNFKKQKKNPPKAHCSYSNSTFTSRVNFKHKKPHCSYSKFTFEAIYNGCC